MVPRLFPCLLALGLALPDSLSRADEPVVPAPEAPAATAAAEPPGLRGPRIGFTAGVGVGFAAFTGSFPFPSFVGTTELQVEALIELERWGMFLRGEFLSSGPGGRWNGPAVALGGQYRLVGDGEQRAGVVLRAGLIYERWTAASAGCNVLYFIPNSCPNYTEPPVQIPGAPPVLPPPSIVANSVGLLAAARFDMPVEPVYLAFDAELSAAKDVDQSDPGFAIAGQLVLTIALRDHVHGGGGPPRLQPRGPHRHVEQTAGAGGGSRAEGM